MDQISYKTTFVNKATAQKEWILIDAENQVVGRLAAKVAKLLRGKYKPSYTQYPGGQRISTPAQEMARFPERVLEHAVRGMLPKSRLGRAVFKNMHLFVGSEHNHESQQPKVIDINAVK